MISYLISLVQVSPATGRAGRCRQISLCVGSTRRVLATLGLPRTGVSVLSPSTLLRLPAALYGAGPALSAVPVFGSSTKARIRLHLHIVSSPRLSGSGSQRLAGLFPPQGAAQAARGLHALSPGAARLFPPRPQRAPPVGSQEVFRTEPGPVCRMGGVASLGLSLPLSPPPRLLPPAGMERLFSGVSQSLCFANRRRCVPAG